jgi:hypothetical protein
MSHKHKNKYADGKYHSGRPHGCEKRTLLYDGRQYTRSRHAINEYDDYAWFVRSKKQTDHWRKLNRLSGDGDGRDYFLVLKLAEAWEKAHTHSDSDSASAPAEEPQSDTRYSRFGLDRQGREKFTTVKLKQGNTLFFSYTLKEGKKNKSGLHWLSFYIAGKSLRYALPEDTTWRFVKRSLTGLSQKLLLKASVFARELYDERQKAGKK